MESQEEFTRVSTGRLTEIHRLISLKVDPGVTPEQLEKVFLSYLEKTPSQPGFPLAAVFDLDGTVFSHVREDGSLIRPHYDYDKVDLDEPVPHVIQMAEIFWAAGAEILFVSGREEHSRQKSADAIRKHSVISYFKLFMRENGNYEKDFLLKERIYRKKIKYSYDVRFIADDRDQVVRMWRSVTWPDIPVMQVAPGNF